MWFSFAATILSIALLTACFAIVANLFFNVVCGVLVLVFCKPVMFERLKLITLLTLRTIIAFFVIFNRNGAIYTDLVRVALFINIMEATMTDFLKNHQPFNGVFGLTGHWNTVVLNEAPAFYTIQGVILGATIAYAIGYTIWNWIFVSGEFSTSVTLMHVAFLGTPLIGSLIMWGITGSPEIGFGCWLLLRANTLTFGGIMQIGAKQYWEDGLYNPKFAKFIDWTHKRSVQIVCMVICLALMAFVIASRCAWGTIAGQGGFLPF